MTEIVLTNSIIEAHKKLKAKTTNTYLTGKEKAELYADVGADGFFLYDHYLSKVHILNPNLKDKYIGKAINWSARKVQTVRLKLVYNNWMCVTTYTNPSTKQQFTKTTLGKELVNKLLEEVKQLA